MSSAFQRVKLLNACPRHHEFARPCKQNHGCLAPFEWIYKAEYNRIQISENNDCLPNWKWMPLPRPSVDGNYDEKKREYRRRCSVIPEELSDQSEQASGLDDAFNCFQKDHLPKRNLVSKKQHCGFLIGPKMDNNTQQMVTAAPFEEPRRDHEGMLKVLNSRKLALDVIQTKLKLEGCDSLVMWLISTKEETLIVDLLPLICDGLQKRHLSPMVALVLVPYVLSLLNSRYEEYVSKALDFIELYLCETPSSSCQFYNRCVLELWDSLISLEADSEKMSKCRYETCLKVQNCLQLVQHLVA